MRFASSGLRLLPLVSIRVRAMILLSPPRLVDTLMQLAKPDPVPMHLAFRLSMKSGAVSGVAAEVRHHSPEFLIFSAQQANEFRDLRRFPG